MYNMQRYLPVSVVEADDCVVDVVPIKTLPYLELDELNINTACINPSH